MFRGLRADEIDLRVGTVGAKGVTMLLYKDARCDMNILDETYGAEFWQRDHKQVKENMFCGVGVWNKALAQWIWKWDCGTESNTEKEKGEASDSFKRACFNLGIGRELYTGGLIFISCKTKPNGSKHELENKFEFSGARVSKIVYSEDNNKREIVGLEISDKSGNVIFKKGASSVANQKDIPEAEKVDVNRKINSTEAAAIKGLAERVNADVPKMLEVYNVKSLDDLTLGQWNEAQAFLNRKKK